MTVLSKPLILIIALLAALSPVAAGKQKEGFLITLQGDSLHGSIKPMFDVWGGVVIGQDKVKFRGKKAKGNFRPKDLAGYGVYENGQLRFFESVKTEKGKRYFLELLEEGRVNYYRFYWGDMSQSLRSDHFLRRKEDAIVFQAPTLSRKKALLEFFADCPLVVQKINEGVYQNEVRPSVIDYNQCQAPPKRKKEE